MIFRSNQKGFFIAALELFLAFVKLETRDRNNAL